MCLYLFFFFSSFASFFSLAVFCGFFFSDFLTSSDFAIPISSLGSHIRLLQYFFLTDNIKPHSKIFSPELPVLRKYGKLDITKWDYFECALV